MPTGSFVLAQSRFEEFQSPAFAAIGATLFNEFNAKFPTVSIAMTETGHEPGVLSRALLGAFVDGEEAGLRRFGIHPSEPVGELPQGLRRVPIRVFDEVRHWLLSNAMDAILDSYLTVSIEVLASRLANLLESISVTHRLAQLEALGELDHYVRLFVHEQNNRLSDLAMHLAILEDTSEKGSGEYKTDLEAAAKGITAIGVLTRSLYHITTFRSYEVLGLGEVVNGVLGLAQLFRVKPPLEISISAEGRTYRTCGIARLVLGTLLTNSMEALIQTRHESVSWKPRIHLEVSIDPDAEQVVFSLSDNGSGMSPEAARRIFSPFFSTKGEGRGVGLYVSRRLAESIGGSLSLAYSEPRKGTQFVLRLPVERTK